MNSSVRIILTVVLCTAVLVIYQFFFAPKVEQTSSSNQASSQKAASAPNKIDEKAAATSSAANTGSGKSDADSQPAANIPAASMPASMPGAGKISTNIDGELAKLYLPGAIATFTSHGAALRSVVLTDPRFQEMHNGKSRQVELVQTEAGKGPWPLTTTFAQADVTLPENADFTKIKHTEKEIIYQWESAQVTVRKHYVVDDKRPVVWLNMQVQNRTDKKLRQRMEMSLFGRQVPGQGQSSFTNPYPKISMVLCYVNGELSRRSASAITGSDSGCTAAGCGMGSGPVSKTGEALWAAVDDRYFLTAVVPQEKDEDRRCELKLVGEEVLQAAMLYPEATIEAGKELKRQFAIFLGAKYLSALDEIKGPQGSESKLAESVEYGWLAVLCRPMMWLMQIFFKVFGNWGVAIILLTIVVKLITLYWTQKSMRSMKEMARLQPKIAQLKEKYGNDKNRMNQEMMALYKVHKVNPLGGCLPMLIQMPVWFALYRTLGNAVELYHSNFALWIKDLTAPDPYYVLPILLGIAMYGQQAITPQTMDNAQAKMMKYFMPGLFTVMMIALPSGLTLYILVNTVLTMIHQWYMNKTDPQPPITVGNPVGKKGPSAEMAGVMAERSTQKKPRKK